MPSVKQHFTSRWGSEGCVIEADWSSLEIIGWAYLTQDPVLLKLIESGEDMHRYIGSKVLNCKPEEIDSATRSKIKACNFLLIYGGWWSELVRTHGMDPATAENLYNVFWDTFSTAQQVQDSWIKEVENNSYYITELTPTGLKRREGWYQDPMGRKYFFKTYDVSPRNRDFGKKTKFKKAEIYNNKVQGLCTANIHMIAIGKLRRDMAKHRDKCLLVNTVHDSVILDSKLAFRDNCAIIIKESMEGVIGILNEKFNLDWRVPLEVEIKSGSSWAEMTKLKI